jgi:hypothetical protein
MEDAAPTSSESVSISYKGTVKYISGCSTLKELAERCAEAFCSGAGSVVAAAASGATSMSTPAAQWEPASVAFIVKGKKVAAYQDPGRTLAEAGELCVPEAAARTAFSLLHAACIRAVRLQPPKTDDPPFFARHPPTP